MDSSNADELNGVFTDNIRSCLQGLLGTGSWEEPEDVNRKSNVDTSKDPVKDQGKQCASPLDNLKSSCERVFKEMEGMCKWNKSPQHCKREQQSKCGMLFFWCILFWCIFGCRATFMLGALAFLHKVLPRALCFFLLAVIVFSSCPSCLLV